MRFRRSSVIVETTNEQLANRIFLGNRSPVLAVKDHDAGVYRIYHNSKLEILSEWADEAGISWVNIERVVVEGQIARLTHNKLIIVGPAPRSDPMPGEENEWHALAKI